MPKAGSSSKLVPKRQYSKLLSTIRHEISLAQTDLQRRRALCYWRIGEFINKDILKHKERADYGSQLFSKLAHDIKIDQGTLQQLVRFNREFPIPGSGTNFNWTAYRKLLGIKDAGSRLRLIKKIQHKRLSTRQIQQEVNVAREKDVIPPKLVVSLGKLYTYRLDDVPMAAAQPDYAIVDCGFNTYRQIPAENLNAKTKGAIVESETTEDWFKLVPSTRSSKDLYTYRARAHRVVDGDTVIFDIDLGFRTWVRVRMRLKGIDAPEMISKRGKEAKKFVEAQLKRPKDVIITSHTPDKFGRYLVDIFVGKEEEYLNQKMLDEGMALGYTK